ASSVSLGSVLIQTMLILKLLLGYSSIIDFCTARAPPFRQRGQVGDIKARNRGLDLKLLKRFFSGCSEPASEVSSNDSWLFIVAIPIGVLY
ncbi:MAG: hypothetical protein PVI06_08040, partial [Desulfobacterales bacterium]